MINTAPWFYVPTVTVLGSIIVAVANYLALRKRDKLERTNKFIDSICLEINSAASLGTEYWLGPKDDIDEKDIKFKEFEMVGTQSRITNLIEILREQDKKIDLSEVDKDFKGFVENFTGGQFKARPYTENQNSVVLIQDKAAEINGHLRKSYEIRAKKFWFW
ncbi:hypothetical protein [Gluconobacter cerinus]|uniref:hypothetical protein n=1 Tax=Gluconobacter cerinus TaxID=38307 RepID=UPI001B8D5029|nr:hypothetical protein [Gluconobacter cerinus]MBS1037192.1 hypothetical protein [Gluconobacter cerinus]